MDDLRARWTSDDAGNLFGRDLFERVPAGDRPRWASAVLELCQGVIPPIAEITDVVRIAERESRWREGHQVFAAVRQRTLENERSPQPDHRKAAVLDVAETTAKIIYNASGAPAPFDYHAGWRLAPRARRVAELAGDPALEAGLWSALVRPLRGAI